MLTSACQVKHIGRSLLGVAPTPGEAIQQRHLHLEVGEHLNNVDVKQEHFNRHPAEGSQVEILQEQGNCDTGGLNGEKGGEISVCDVTAVRKRSSLSDSWSRWDSTSSASSNLHPYNSWTMN